MGKICANSDSAPGANSWLSCLRKAPENIRFSGELSGTRDELLRVTQQFGLEGLVAKRRSSLYESGRRSGAWVKFKITKSQEFAVGGYTLPEGSRSHLLPCWSVTRVPRDSCSPAESAPVFRKGS